MVMETIDALGFEKDQAFDRYVGCSVMTSSGIIDINHNMFDGALTATDTELTISLEMKNGIKKLTECLSNTERISQVEVAMSNDQMSLLLVNCFNIQYFKYEVVGNTLKITFTGTETEFAIDSNYQEIEYFKKRE